MILTNNGRVVVIDDEIDDVRGLLVALKKEGMPYLFFTERAGEDLPESGPIDDVRLVFLDLDLGLGNAGVKEKIRVVQSRLVKIVKPNTPYALVIWSRHEDQYASFLLDEFEGSFSDYKPIFCCGLEKERILALSMPEMIPEVRKQLKENLQSFESFNAFLLWESIVSRSSGEIVNGFTRIFDLDENWDKNTKAFFYRLALANVGKEKVESLNDSAKLQLALETITSALNDSIENNLSSELTSVEMSIKESGANITSNHLIKINTKLHVIKSDLFNHFHSGNLYLRDFPDNHAIENIVRSVFDKKVVDAVLDSEPLCVQIDVTPTCDYSQNKGYTRVLGGILVQEEFYASKKSSTAIYIYDLCPVLNVFGNNYYLIFDFRSFKSFKQELVSEIFSKPTHRIREQLLIDLQAGLSNHINRPGIITVK